MLSESGVLFFLLLSESIRTIKQTTLDFAHGPIAVAFTRSGNQHYFVCYFAELAGLHRTYVSSVERGERNISLLNIERLAVALSVPMAKLMP